MSRWCGNSREATKLYWRTKQEAHHRNQNSPLPYDKPLKPWTTQRAALSTQPLSQAAGKLGFHVFVRLLYRLFARVRSLRALRTDVQSQPMAQALGFTLCGLSTFHKAFVRDPSLVHASDATRPSRLACRIVRRIGRVGPTLVRRFVVVASTAPVGLAGGARLDWRAIAFGFLPTDLVRGEIHFELRPPRFVSDGANRCN